MTELGATGAGYLLVLVSGGVVSAGVAAYAYRQPDHTTRIPFVGLTGSMALWVGVYAVSLTVRDPAARRLMVVASDATVGLLPIWWILLALGYAGLDQYVTKRTFLAAAVVPALAVLGSATNRYHGLIYTDVTVHQTAGLATVSYEVGPLLVPYLAYVYVLIGVGVLVMIRVAFVYDSLISEQAVSLLVAAIVPSIAAVLWFTGRTPIPGLRMTPFSVPVVVLAYWNALYRQGLLDVTPSTTRIGRDAAIENLPDCVLTLDAGGRVADCNEAVEETFGCTQAEVVGRPVEAVLGDVDLDLEGTSTLDVRTADGRRRFEVRSSTVADASGTQVGHTVVLRDVTRRALREQRLTVLNRVLRHNLRNDVTVVNGYVDRLAAEADDPELAAKTRAVTDGLIDLGRKAKEFHDALEDDSPDQQIRVRELLEHVVADHGDGECAVSVDAAPETTVETDRAVLELVVGNLLENACEHAGSDPLVRLAGRQTAHGVEIAVEDDGPGIPEEELGVLSDGTETSLRHGSGLGLWIVTWGVEYLGGDVSFEADADGTTAVVRVPDRSRASVGIDEVDDPRGDGVADGWGDGGEDARSDGERGTGDEFDAGADGGDRSGR